MDRMGCKGALAFVKAYVAVVFVAVFAGKFLPAYSAAVNGLLMVGIPTAVCGKSLKELGFKAFGRGVAYGLAFSALILPVYYLVCRLFFGVSPFTFPSADLLVYLLTVAVSEEIFFRGFFYSVFENREVVKGLLTMNNLLSSLLFGAAHALIYWDPLMLKVFFPSLVMGWLYERSGSIFAPITFHFLSDLLYYSVRCL